MEEGRWKMEEKNKKMVFMIVRNLHAEIKDLIAQKRSIFLFGPRQTGKTTLLEAISSQYRKVLEYSFLNIALL
jgi:predicted AAA+ superfamily ATPase